MTTAMSKTTKELKHQEEIIQDGLQSFLHVGRALIAIRDGELYEEAYETFESYCKKRWNFGSNYAYRLINSAEVVSELLPIGNTENRDAKAKTQVLPSNESQARAVIAAADTPEDRAKVWQAAVAAAPKNSAGEPVVTAKIVKAAAEEVLGPVKPKAPKTIKEQVAENSPKENPSPRETGRPSGGTKFDPKEFDPDVDPDDRQEIKTEGLPAHIVPVLADHAEYKSLQRELSILMGKVKLLAAKPIGSYIVVQEVERHIGQVKADMKAYSFGDTCPDCENKPNEKCLRCRGRGWIAHGQMGQLSDFNKAWLKDHSVRP